MTNSRGGNRRRSNGATSEVERTENIMVATDAVTVGAVKVDLDTRVMLPVSIPLGLKIELEKFAAANNTEATELARKAIADIVDYTLPAMSKRGRTSTMSDEEKKERAKERNEQRRDAVKALLQQYGVASGSK